MGKILVRDGDQGKEEVPFLRGILTRSLLRTGLSFEEAYQLSSEVRQDLFRDKSLKQDKETGDSIVTLDELRDQVLAVLQRRFGEEVAERYRNCPYAYTDVSVNHRDGSTSAFSRRMLGNCLRICGLSDEDAASITIRVYQHLIDRGRTDVTTTHLRDLVGRVLQRELGHQTASRYEGWLDHRSSDKSLLILIGGTAASGKSTLASELARLLGVLRTQSTDMLREVMRMMVPQRLMPTLHLSSFNAWRALPGSRDSDPLPEELLCDGFRAQAAHVSVACHAVIQRARNERVSLILEGVHVYPGMFEKLEEDPNIIVAPFMLGILKPDQLEARIRGRGTLVPERRAHRYLNDFDSIWRLQSYLLSEADRAGVPIVENSDIQLASRQVLEIILDKITESQARAKPRATRKKLATRKVSQG